MKNSGLLILGAFVVIFSCTGLPRTTPLDAVRPAELHNKCCSLFLDGDWQFVHSIDASLPGGNGGVIMGVTIISVPHQTIKCVIMTIEGFVLFEAEYDQTLLVTRSVSPFDSKAFAKALIKDIQLIFFRPGGKMIESGILDNGLPVCRYETPGQRIVDIILHNDNTWEIQQFSSGFRLNRSVKLSSSQKAPYHQPPIPDNIKIEAHGLLGYTLIMNLVEAIPLTQ